MSAPLPDGYRTVEGQAFELDRKWFEPQPDRACRHRSMFPCPQGCLARLGGGNRQ